MSRKLTQDEFLTKCIKNQKISWDYSRLEYKGLDYHIEVGCPVHGFIFQNAYSHSIGLGCKQCADEVKSKEYLLSRKEYIEKANKKHNFFFTYDNFVYKGMDKKAIVTCPIHGDFEILASNHLKRGCSHCNNEIKKERIRLQNELNFFKKIKDIHPTGYTYPRFEYINAHKPAIITCDKHGDFKQKPNLHIRGHGCPKCGVGNISKREIEVQEFVKSLGYELEFNTRKIIKPYELDIYIPKLNKAIEFNGEWWHYSEKNPNSRGEEYHNMKTEMCDKLGIKLIHLRESDWNSNKILQKEKIKKFINNN